MSDVIRRLRDALRPPNENDVWIGEPPTREELEDRLGNDEEARALLFDWSMAEFVERYLSDERLQIGYLGQGVIGTNASPFDPGTAVHSLPSFLRPPRRLSRRMGLCQRRNGHGLVLFWPMLLRRLERSSHPVWPCRKSYPAKACCSRAENESTRP